MNRRPGRRLILPYTLQVTHDRRDICNIVYSINESTSQVTSSILSFCCGILRILGSGGYSLELLMGHDGSGEIF